MKRIYSSTILPILILLPIVGIVTVDLRLSQRDERRENSLKARKATACGSLNPVDTFWSADKLFVVCSPDYLSKPEDFVVKEVPSLEVPKEVP